MHQCEIFAFVISPKHYVYSTILIIIFLFLLEINRFHVFQAILQPMQQHVHHSTVSHQQMNLSHHQQRNSPRPMERELKVSLKKEHRGNIYQMLGISYKI